MECWSERSISVSILATDVDLAHDVKGNVN